jgi:hypothetical protein
LFKENTIWNSDEFVKVSESWIRFAKLLSIATIKQREETESQSKMRPRTVTVSCQPTASGKLVELRSNKGGSDVGLSTMKSADRVIELKGGSSCESIEKSQYQTEPDVML